MNPNLPFFLSFLLSFFLFWSSSLSPHYGWSEVNAEYNKVQPLVALHTVHYLETIVILDWMNDLFSKFSSRLPRRSLGSHNSGSCSLVTRSTFFSPPPYGRIEISARRFCSVLCPTLKEKILVFPSDFPLIFLPISSRDSLTYLKNKTRASLPRPFFSRLCPPLACL